MILLCSFAFIAFLASCATPAREVVHPVKDHPFVTAKSKGESIKHLTCPTKIALDSTIVYPQDTGNAVVDQYFEKYSSDFLENSKTSYQESVLNDPSVCTFDYNLFSHADFDSYKAGANTLGILYTLSSFVGGAHEELDYRAFNFNLTNGLEMHIKDLFPRPKTALPKLYNYVYTELCTATDAHGAASTVLGGTCGTDKLAPKEFSALNGSLDQIGHMILTADGANLNFLPLDLWSWAQGPYTLSIPKEKLIEFGAKDIWGK